MSKRSLHPRHAVLLLALAIAAAVIALVVVDLGHEHRLAIESASLRTQRLSRILEEHARQNLRRIELDLASAAAALIPLDPLDPLYPGDPAALRVQLQQQLSPTESIHALVLIGADGKVLASSSDEAAVSAATYVGRTEFSALRKGTAREPLIGAPLMLEGAPHRLATPALPIALRLGPPDGGFHGALLALVELDTFQRFYDSFDTGTNGFATLFLRDGWIAVRAPANAAVTSRNWSDSPMFRVHLPQNATGTVRQVVAADLIERIYCYRVLADQPLIVAFGISLAEVLTGWRERLWRDITILLLALLVLGVASWSVMRTITRRESAQRAVSDHEADFFRFTEESSDWRWKLNADLRFVQVLDSMVPVEGTDVPTHIGKTPWEVPFAGVSGADWERQRAILLDHQPFRDFELQRPDVGGSMRWVSISGMPLHSVKGVFEGYRGIGRDISGRKLREAQAARESTRLRILFEQASDAICVMNLNFDVIEANASFARLIGCSLEEAFQRHPWDWSLEFTTLELCRQRWPEAPHVQQTYQTCWRDGQGGVHDIDVSINRLEWGGQPLMMCVSRDITARKRAERALETQRLRMEGIIESALDGIITIDADERIVVFNSAAQRIFRCRAEDMVGQPVECLLPERMRAEQRATIRRFSETHDTNCVMGQSGQLSGLRTDGEEFPAEASISQIDVGGYKFYAVTLRDVTLQRRSQEQIMLLQTCVERLNDIVIITEADPVGEPGPRIVFVNQAFERITGYRREEVLGRTPRLLQGPQTQRNMLDLIRTALTQGEPMRCELLNYTKTGDQFWVEIDIVPIVNAEGRPTHFVAVERDIGERKQADVDRRGLETQLRESQKMEAMGTLAGGIAHDFNNILASILGNVALAREDAGPGHPALLSLSQIGQAGRRARGLVDQILAFSRRQPQELVVQPLQPLVRDTLALMRSTLPAMVTLESTLTAEPVHVLADTIQMQQVLMNLCTNAWHALQGRSGTLQVGLDVRDGEPSTWGAGSAPPHNGLTGSRHAHLWVRDTGIGMDPATLAHIFEPFFTTKQVGLGTGLGLSVVHGIVSAHHGAITVESVPGAGSTFHLYFSLHAAPPVSALAAHPFDPSALAPLEGMGEHVMYVDDDEVMVLMVGRLLERAGFKVTCCANAREAMARVEARPDAFDIVVTDFNMPELSGIDLAQWLARTRPNLPVVITSGYLSDELREPARLAGVRRLMHKQNTLEELARLIREVLATA